MAKLENLYNKLTGAFGNAPYSLDEFKEYATNKEFLGNLYDDTAKRKKMKVSRERFIDMYSNADDRIPNREEITGLPEEYGYSGVGIERMQEASQRAEEQAEMMTPKKDNTTYPYMPESFTGGQYDYGQIAPGVEDKQPVEPAKPITQQDVKNLGRTIDQSISAAQSVQQSNKDISSQYKRQFTKGFEERAIDAQNRWLEDSLGRFEDQLSTIENDIRGQLDKKSKKESTINPLVQGILREENVIIPGEEGPNTTQSTTLRLLSQARDVIDMYKRKDKNGLSNFFDAFGRSVDTGMLTLGISDAIDLSKVLSVANKINASEDGFEKLPKDEKQLITAYSLLDQIQNSLQLSNSQRWGQGTADSLGFMLSFAATGGLGSAASKGVAKGVETAAKKIIKNTARNVVNKATQRGVGKAVRNVATTAGKMAVEGIVGGLTTTLTGGIGYTAAEIERRLIGTPSAEVGYDGTYKFNGITGQETLGGAIVKGLANQAIENGTEYLGSYIGINAGRLFSKFPGISRLLTKPIPKRFSRTMNRIARLSGFNGFIPEVAEEEIGMILNAATLGETKWEDITDLQNQLDILVQVGIISGGFQIANFSSTGYHYNKYREARRQYEAIDYGEGSRIIDIDALLENTPIDQRTDVIDAIANSYNFDNADKAKLANYVMRKTNYDFILGEIQERAQQAGDEAAKNEMRFINEAMGGKVYVTLSDGRTAVVTSGQLSTEKGEDGLYSTTDGSDSVVVIPTDVEGAKPMLVSMKDITNIDAITPTEQALQEARAAAESLQTETDATTIETEAAEEVQTEGGNTQSPQMNYTEQAPVYKENDEVIYTDSMGQQQEGTVKNVQPDGVNIVSVVNGIPQEDFVPFENVQPKQVQQEETETEDTTGTAKLAQTEETELSVAETQPSVEEEQTETDRWSQYRKPNGEVDTKKMTFQEQMEYGEENLGVDEMVSLAKNGVNATQKQIDKLQKQYDSEIDPGKKVSKKKQLDGLQERLKAYQAYLDANDENRQSTAQTPQNLIGRLNALGDIRSLRDFILREIASGNAKFKWADSENGTKGLASHLGIKNSPKERRMRISLLSNSGYTPEEFAHYIWERQDAQNSDLPFRGYETDEILDEVIDVLQSVYSPKQALEQAEEIRDKEMQQQEEYGAGQQQEATESAEEQQIEPAEETEPVNEELPFERTTDDYVPFRQENEQKNEIEGSQVGQVTFTQEEIKDYINEEAGKLNIPIRIIENVEDITEEEPRYREKRRSKGWFDVNTGEIVIVAPNHTSIRDAQKTILHEAVAHYGLRGLVGTENFDGLCDLTWAEMTDSDRIYFAAYAEGKNIDSLAQEDIDTFTSDDYANKRIAADEYLASVAENGITEPTVWQKIKSAIKDLFNKIGIDLQIDDADIAYMLWKSKNRITDNDDMQTVVDKSAADAQMRKDIGERFRGINSGYTQREDGTNISVNAFEAEQDGTFTEGTFRKVYGVSKNDFNILSMLGIVKYSEWHHTGTNFTRSRFYSWGDSDRVVDNGYSYANSTVQDGSFAQIYRENKKQIGKLVKEFDAKNWEYETDQEETNKNTAGKEKTLLEIASIFGLEDADKVVNYQSYANRRKIQEDAIDKEFEEKRKQLDIEQDKRKKSLDKWLQSNKEKGNITEYSRIPAGTEPKFFVEEKREMNGRYGWLNATRVYNLPIYVSGIGFKSKRLYDSYINKTKEIREAYWNLDREYAEARQNLRFRVGEEYTQEEQEIIDRAKQAGIYLKAPNGSDTNLTPKQWAQVRTKAFKDWFGDWENSPETASKVVDENGEPRVVYHGSPNEFTVFDTSKIGSSTGTSDGRGFYFTTRKSYAESFASQDGNLFEVFLDIRNPLSYDKKTITKAQLKKIFRSIDKSEYEREGEHYTLSNYADYTRVGIENTIAEAVNLEYEYAYNDVELINSIIAGSGDLGLVMNAVRGVTGKSSMIAPKGNGDIHYIVTFPTQIKSATDNVGTFSEDNPDIRFRIREEEPPKNTGIGYKVFVLKNGKLYPPMVANPGGEETPVGVWLDADAAPIAGQSKTGRKQVKAGGKGTQGGSGKLAYRPGWHLGEIPYAIQFNRKNPITGEKELFPKNFVWAEVEYADDIDYQKEAYSYGINSNGKYQHSLAGLPYLPINGSYKYRTNPNPETDPWIITGSMRVNRLLTPSEVDKIVNEAGRNAQQREEGYITDDEINELNKKLNLDSIRFRSSRKNREREVIEIYDIDHEGIANNVKKFAEENLEPGTYDFFTARTGSIYMNAKIGGSNVEVRMANHTKAMRYDQSPHLLGDGFSIDFYKDGSVNVSMDIVQNGMTDLEINQFLKELKEYENSPIKERVMLLLEGADTVYPNIAEGEMANQLYAMMGDRFVEALNSTIRENHHYALNQEVKKQEDIMQKSQSNIRFTIGNALKDDVFHWYATTSDKMLYDISGGYWFNATNGYLKITPNILEGSIFFDPQSIEKKLVSAYFVPAIGVNKRKAKKEAIQEYVSDYVTTLSNAPIYDSDKIIEGGSNIVQARYNIDQLKQEYNIWHFAKFGYPAPDVITRFRRIDMPDVSTLVTENNGVYEVNLQNLLPEEEDRVRELAKSMSYVTITGDIVKFPDRDMAENAVRNAMMFYGDLSDEITNIPYDVTPLDVMEKLDQRIKKGKLKRIWIDQYQPLKALQTMIEKKLGITIPENLDAWEATGYMDSQAAAQLDEYKARYYEPLLELYVKLSSGAGVSEKELTDYLLIKHGIERNQVFRAEELKEWEDREQEAIKNKNLKTKAQKEAAQQDYEKRRAEYIEQLRQKDYSGYYEYFTNELSNKYDTPEDFISYVENTIGSDMTASIWDKIRAATNRTLDIAYNAGSISKESRAYYKSRFMYYVPLRGFEGDTMDGTYSSRYKIGGRSSIDKRAGGRTSMADNPLVYIATMAATEIDRASKNDMKKILLRLLNSSNVKEAFSGHYVIEKSDGSTEKVIKLPKNRSGITRITHVPGVYQISRKYQYLMFDENGMPILDSNGNQMWEDRDEEPTPEELANRLARLSYNPKAPKSAVIKTPAQQDESSVSVYINGEEIKITFTNPDLARSVNGQLNPDSKSEYLQKISQLTRYMANNYTTLSPAFVFVTNFARDAQTSFLNNLIEHGGKTAVNTVGNYKPAFLAMRRYIFKEGIKKRPTDSEISISLNKIKNGNRMTNHDYDVLAYLFISRGGETGYIGMQNVDKYRKEMQDLMKYSDNKTIEVRGELKKRNLMRRGVKFMGDTARLMEDITRFSQFLQALKQGDSVSKAATKAKNISTNFNRRGSHEGVNWVFAHYAFLNATLQGTYRQWQIAKAHPYRTAGITVMFPFLMGVAEAVAGYFWGGDDDDFGKKYYELSEFKRHNYMCIPTIFSDNFITIPLPQIYRTFHALGCMVVDQIYNKSNPITTKDITTVDLLTTAAQDIMPLQYGSVTNIIPTVYQPIATILLNKTFTGAPLYKDTPYNQNMPEYRKAYGNTSNIFVEASKMINDITGGNYAEKGWFEKLPFIGKLSNPAVLQQLALSYLPGLPRVATQFTIAGESAVRKTREAEEDFSISEVPIAGTLIGDPTDRIPRSVIRSHWYDFTEKAREIKRVDRELLTNMFIDEFAENQNSENIIPAETYSKVSGIVLKLLQRDKENRQLENKLQNGLIPADQIPSVRAQFEEQSRETDKTIKELLESLYNAGIDIKSK